MTASERRVNAGLRARRAVLSLAAATVGILPVSATLAQDAEEAPGLLAEVVDNARYESETVLSLYPRPPDQAKANGIENQDVEAWTHLSVESDTFLNDYWTLGIGLEAVASTYSGAERGLFTRPGSRSGHGRYLDASRLTLTYLGDVVEVTMGKDSVPFGVAEIYSPTDIHGAENSVNPQHAVDFGVWQVRADAYLGSGRLTGIVMPVEESTPGPHDSSRWGGGNGSGGSEFAAIDIPGLPPGLTAEIEEDLRGVTPEEWGYLVQYKGTATGLDYFVSGFNGPGPYPVLRAPDPGRLNPYDKIYPRVTTASFGAALTEGSWKLYAEGVGYWAMRGRDDDLARGLIGAKYRETRLANRMGLDEIAPVVEYAREVRLDSQSDPDYVLSSEDARPNRNNIIASLTVTVDSEWEFGGVYNRALDERDNLASLFLRYEPTDNLRLSWTATRYEGPDDTLFGRYDRNDNVEFAVNYSF